jgi:hypothetical protein
MVSAAVAAKAPGSGCQRTAAGSSTRPASRTGSVPARPFHGDDAAPGGGSATVHAFDDVRDRSPRQVSRCSVCAVSPTGPVWRSCMAGRPIFRQRRKRRSAVFFGGRATSRATLASSSSRTPRTSLGGSYSWSADPIRHRPRAGFCGGDAVLLGGGWPAGELCRQRSMVRYCVGGGRSTAPRALARAGGNW